MSGKRELATTLADMVGIALVAIGLVGYDWRIAVIVVGVLVLAVSRMNR